MHTQTQTEASTPAAMLTEPNITNDSENNPGKEAMQTQLFTSKVACILGSTAVAGVGATAAVILSKKSSSASAPAADTQLQLSESEINTVVLDKKQRQLSTEKNDKITAKLASIRQQPKNNQHNQFVDKKK